MTVRRGACADTRPQAECPFLIFGFVSPTSKSRCCGAAGADHRRARRGLRLALGVADGLHAAAVAGVHALQEHARAGLRADLGVGARRAEAPADVDLVVLERAALAVTAHDCSSFHVG
jgi:hypothetical protein